jgi:cytochrome bd-type quinol oxidase subunit 2
MTHEEMENEIASLREQALRQRQQEEARQKNWRSIRTGATIIALLLCAAAFGLIAVGLWLELASSPSRSHLFVPFALLLTVGSLPMTFLKAALTDPTAPR